MLREALPMRFAETCGHLVTGCKPLWDSFEFRNVNLPDSLGRMNSIASPPEEVEFSHG